MCDLLRGFLVVIGLGMAATLPAQPSNNPNQDTKAPAVGGNRIVAGNATVTSNTTTTVSVVPVATPASAAEWRSIIDTLGPISTPIVNGKKAPAQIAIERSQRADRFQQVAQQAKTFLLRYPNDPNAPKAKKLEVTASLESARLGRDAIQASALTLATAYRVDKNQSREDRFEVALTADRLQLTQKNGGKSLHEKPADYEKLADNLHKEFGEIPEIYGLYTGIAGAVDMESANRIATKVLEMRPPAFAKAEAQVITARYGLVGRPFALRLSTVDGQRIELPTTPALSGPTVIYVWTMAAGGTSNPFAELSLQRAKLAKGVRWIYLGMPATAAQVNAVKAKAPFSGTHCIDDASATSAVAQHLKVRSSPTVFVLNRQGVLTGFGRVDELPALLTAAAR